MRTPAYVAAALILALGVLALLAPSSFAALLAALQPSPMLYLAAATRCAIGVSFFLAARRSRSALAFQFLGFVMVVGGIATPIIGQGLARPILDAWLNGSVLVVRCWGIAAILLGAFTFWALRPREHQE